MNLPCTVQKIVIIRHCVDFRKSFNGLLAESYRLGFDPYKGECIVFIKSNKSQVRGLVGDQRGLYLIYRRFDEGCLGKQWKHDDKPSYKESSLAELAMIFEGNIFTVHRKIKKWKK